MAKRNYRLDFEVLSKFKTGEWAVQPTLGQIYLTKERRMLASQKCKNGYLKICVPPYESHYPLSRAVWIGATMNVPEFEELEVDHINEIKTDNRFENLRLLTPAGNIRRSKAALTYETAEEIRKKYAAGGVSLYSLGKQYECSHTTIRNIVKQHVHAHPKPQSKIKKPYENLSQKTKEDIFHTFCVEGRKLESTLKQYKITKETLWYVIEEQSLRTNSAKYERIAEREASTTEPHHHTNKGDMKP